MRRIFAACVMVLALCGACNAGVLPDVVGEWRCVNEHVQSLITEYNHESHGRITYRTYTRESPAGMLEVILTEGSGAGSLYVPESVRAVKGVMPSESGFELVKVSGHDAIIEAHSYMPIALAVNAGENITFTLESPSLNREELIRVAEEILSWRNTNLDSFPAP